MKLLSAAAMRTLDRRAIEEIGLPGAILMENAGRGAAEVIAARHAAACPGPVAILCGSGNNGGDGLVVARHLRDAGWQVSVLLLAPRRAVSGDAALMLRCFEASGGTVAEAVDVEALAAALAGRPFTLCIDALFGTGLTRPPEGLAAAAIAWLNSQPAPVAALDLPSGVAADSGAVPGTAVRAALTVTFALPKIGLYSYPGAGYAGEVVTVPIGLPQCLVDQTPGDCRLVDAGEARSLLPRRPRDGHKGTFGHLLAVAGARGKSGAAALTAMAALRGGAGLVTLACPSDIQGLAAAHAAEIMVEPLADEDGALAPSALPGLLALVEGKQALAIGPGLGSAAGTGALLAGLLAATTLPVVLDADALNLLAGRLELLAPRRGLATVLTPHPGEMARLCGQPVAAVQADRLGTARRFAGEHQVVLVLKGARTVIAAPDGQLFVNGSGHAGMASGGMGDVLTGVIGALLAQGLPALEAAALGTYLHGLAGDRLRGEFGDAGLLAGDLLRALPAARQSLQ